MHTHTHSHIHTHTHTHTHTYTPTHTHTQKKKHMHSYNCIFTHPTNPPAVGREWGEGGEDVVREGRSEEGSSHKWK